MFWCYNCQQSIQSVQQLSCELCSCEAIEQISPQNHPQNFQPYFSQPNSQPNTQTNQNHQQRSSRLPNFTEDHFGIQMLQNIPLMRRMSMVSTLLPGIGDNNAPIYIRYTVSMPTLAIFLLDNQDEVKNPVPHDRVEELEKVEIKQQCAICQQKEGAGLKLPCNHEFHENCIKPWFEQTNTCPCCRTAV